MRKKHMRMKKGVLRCNDALNRGGWEDLRDKHEKDALYTVGLMPTGIR